MDDLFAGQRRRALGAVEPLAARLRPRTLAEFVGQEHVLGEGKILRRMIDADAITSLILHGPPGTGKTTLAEVIAHATQRRFVRENAASVGVKRIREVIDDSVRSLEGGGPRTILFLDEIHRFTRSQQDVLLGDVERGVLTLIGATTENPLFACNAALVSRSTLIRLEPLSEEDVIALMRRAIADEERGLGRLDVRVEDEALRVWAVKCDGDARRALTALEVAVLSAPVGPTAGAPEAGRHRPEACATVVITQADAEESIQRKAAVYDRGDAHYDCASALIKSIRGSDPDAAVYWVARMLEGGEDPRFIARRLAILASEDIGNADPRAITVAASTWDLVERIGMPEARITLGHCATYLAMAPKSNAAYLAIEQAMQDAREGRTVPVPLHLRDPNSSPLTAESGAGERVRDRRKHDGDSRYVYSHGEQGGVGRQEYLGVDRTYYEPTDRGFEATLRERLAELRRLRGRERES